ncbi:unnamed protein product [Plutella xylostella]|uniref:(diamondback moth) hypothetical protein n=1 Tax=Plutella xylostella TaxID=51655 RepID=A0A8S4FV93_PLUXY|nr:unnamed protein product [Plutella xylostella]
MVIPHHNLIKVDFVPVSTVDVEAVVGRRASLPCDIEPDTKEDRVYMVLWFRHSGGKPLYRSAIIMASLVVGVAPRNCSMVDIFNHSVSSSSSSAYSSKLLASSKALNWMRSTAFFIQLLHGPRHEVSRQGSKYYSVKDLIYRAAI